MSRFAAAIALAGALALFAAPAHAAYDDAGYWSYADRLQQQLDPLYRNGTYHAGGGGTEPMVNSLMLLTHSVAALEGHQGPARNDERARSIADALVTRAYTTQKRAGQAHAPGWTNGMDGRGSQHLVFDAEVVDGLVYAYRARRELQLPEETVDRIRSAIADTARGSFWRYPTIRLNQVNWYALMYAADNTVTGDTTLLKHDLYQQLLRFIRGARGTASAAGNFGPGMRFHYLPHERLNHPMNVDSAEYANIVLSFTRFYDQARRAGMPALPATHKAMVGEWITRALAGYWTHGGYMNWDSGLGFQRWHQAKKLGLTQQALIGIAQSASLGSANDRRWAKFMLDRSLEFYERTAERDGGVADALFFNVHAVPQGVASARLGAARVLANAARALDAGLGRAAASEPPALYAYDPDIGRLAVTTPAYNTAIVAVNQRAFPYGGVDLARLFNGSQEVAATIGGTPPASFGAVVKDRNGRRVLASQIGRSSVDRGVTPLRLTRAPRGAGASAAASVGRAFAGPFTTLEATGTVRNGAAAIRVTHRFTPRDITTRWDVTHRPNAGADVLFPSTGKSAHVIAVLRDGTRARFTKVALDRVARFEIETRYSGYTITPLTRPKGATARLLHPAAQSSAPDAGPTLAVDLGSGTHTALTARITPKETR